MCGISGFIATTALPARFIGQMTDMVRHRGPDGEGFVLFQASATTPIVCAGKDTSEAVYRSDTVYTPKQQLNDLADHPITLALGHRRLSIVDLSALGHQPMSSPDGRYWIVFNGEVYNHIELRAELEPLGHHFISHTDTEVILAAYQEWGEACLSRFNGMWAFAIYDTVCNTLFLARDRFGVKPLYYWVSPAGLLAFGSEIKQFTVLPGWTAKINGQRSYDFLVFGLSDHTEETLFAGVYQLQPGHSIVIQPDKLASLSPTKPLATLQWYRLQPAPFQGSFAEASTAFARYFEQAVALRLRADVLIGSCLSGGLDSSSIVCVMNKFLHQQNATALQKTFSACADVARFDERQWIEKVVAKTGVEAHYVYPTLENLFAEFPNITWHQDEPFGSTSIYAQWQVFKSAAQNGVKVMLDGQGSDEQLAGYHSFFGPYLASLFRNMQWAELYREMAAIYKLHGYSHLTAIKYLLLYILPNGLLQPLKKLGGYAHVKPAWINLSALHAQPIDPFVISRAREGTIQALSLSQLTASNLQMLLHWEDRDSMAHSIEARIPFLDYRLVEFVLGLPDTFKIHHGITKRVLRNAMSGILPDAIRDRVDKLGFVTPEEVWLREHAPELFQTKITAALQCCGDIFNAEVVKHLLADMIAGRCKFNFLPWRIISFGEWVKKFSVIVE